jgi:NADH:ubiquinone oxidoreductase subunit 4 (subunit M)
LRLILLAALAWNGLYDLDLFPVVAYDQAADEDDAALARVRAQPLERSVVSLFGVVIVVMGVYPICVHSP